MNNLIIKQKYHNYYFLGTDKNNYNYYLEDILLNGHYCETNHIKEHFDIVNFWLDDNHFVLTKNKDIDWFFSLENQYLSDSDKFKIYELCNTIQVLANFISTISCGYSGITRIEEEKEQLLGTKYPKKQIKEKIQKLWEMVVKIFEKAYERKGKMTMEKRSNIYYFLGTNDNGDYYLAEPSYNNNAITNYCELSVFEKEMFTERDLIECNSYFGDDNVISLEDFLLLDNNNLSPQYRTEIFNICKEINSIMSTKEYKSEELKEIVLDKWKLIENIFNNVYFEK